MSAGRNELKGRNNHRPNGLGPAWWMVVSSSPETPETPETPVPKLHALVLRPIH